MVGGVLFEKLVPSDNRVVMTSSHPFYGLGNESGDKNRYSEWTGVFNK